MDLFRVRLNCIDHYQATPTRYDPQLRNDIRPSQITKGPKVPVIRIFGSTETGQKVCAHVHGAFPYLYVEYEGGLDPDEVGAYIYSLHLSIDHALAVSYRRDLYRDNPSYVARITLVKGVPFYGFHVGYRCFLKIYMFNPMVMTRLADLLQQGAIMKHKFQPYEAHLQYLLQFMTDYNLYGCDYLDSSIVRFRSPVPEYGQGSNSSHAWNDWSIPAELITDDTTLPRASHCSIEVDICAQHILNRTEVKERALHHDFIERIKPIPSDLKLVHSMAGLWKDETKRRARKMKHQGNSPFPTEALVSMSADPRASQPQGWIHEEEYRDQIRDLIATEKDSQHALELQFETFTNPRPFEEEIRTALQSVEDLFPANLVPALGLSSQYSQKEQDPTGSIDVDEIKASQIEVDDFFPDDSDEEALTMLASMNEKRPFNIAPDNMNQPTSDSRSRPVPSRDIPSNLGDLLNMGICQSGLASGMLPDIPLTQDLVQFADADGLVSRTPKVLPPEFLDRIQSKRPLFESPSGQPSPKRSKLTVLFSDDPKRLSQKVGESLPMSIFSKPHGPSISHRPSPRSSPLSQTSMEIPSSNQTLNFAIVKDQNNPGIKFSLSQRSHQSSSQLSEDGKPKKLVSFEPSTITPVVETKPHTEPFLFSSLPSSALEELDFEGEAQEHVVEALSGSKALVYSIPPPSSSEVAFSMQEYEVPDVIYQDAHYSKEKDVPTRTREYAGQEFRLKGNTLLFLPEFDSTGTSPANYGLKQVSARSKATLKREYAHQRKVCTWRAWEFASPPPTYDEVETWWQKKTQRCEKKEPSSSYLATPRDYVSQIDGPTPKNKHGFKYSQARKSTSVEHEAQYMSTMSLEVHVNTRGKLVPNPEEDEVQCIFWALKSDETVLDSQQSSDDVVQSGIIVQSQNDELPRQMRRQNGMDVIAEISELDLMLRMVEVVRSHDPDILTGYEVHGSSWGYLIERARLKYDYNLCDEFSRMKTESHGRFGKENDRWGFNTTSTIRVTGRHMINIWRAMRGELNLLQYTMENVVWHLLHRRIPHYAWATLTSWYTNGRHRDLHRLLHYYRDRTRLDIEILEANELVSRTSEQARLLGVDFFSVFSRGSQFKVESIMFRIAKPENLMLVSPSRKQVGGQNALECLPLVMEPQSAFYNSPLLVLDFQSLYPSVMIAYNYCYSTFLGRITNWRGMNKMGFTEYERQQGLLALLQDEINIAPNGMMYVKPGIRKSLLAKMLTEILETRVMVKNGMKQDKDDKTLQQLLNNRQLALKLLANVTYGYTSASFSGRMPCSEIADSIVQTGRESLERAVAFIHSVERWGAEVVYGDTDSLFVYLKGRTKDQAFTIGKEIAKAITDMNPQPIKLKFEKVYHPCVLLAKKRYVGYKYESADQAEPEFDAKGIETVRRDGTPAEQKIEEKALRLLFETADLSQIKAYFRQQCDKIMRNNVSVQDFCFAKEVRLGTYSDKGRPPPGALISTKRMLEDARAEPQYGERVPYVVITGAPGARLSDRCVAPEELLSNPHWQLDAGYYINKNLIPPLERIFNLVGASVQQWYDEMPKVRRVYRPALLTGKKRTLEFYMRSTNCLICRAKFTHKSSVLCRRCRTNVPASLQTLQKRVSTEERRLQDVMAICRSCSGLGPSESVSCDSKDCPVFWTRMRQNTKTLEERHASEPVIQALTEEVDKLSLEW
ncbi:hypothetical protein BGZ63DRAFT_481699 [Mariannaea sp. PMI_226]|nr:hypothetical protein BGZ63DRAFT_481699 [Mariannaea sp. PMI_226]